MNIDRELILKLEKLARLQLSDKERATMQGDLNKILGMVEKLDELDLEDVQPLLHLMETKNVTREDKEANQIATTTAMQNAPDSTDEYFKVPKVIKK